MLAIWLSAKRLPALMNCKLQIRRFPTLFLKMILKTEKTTGKVISDQGAVEWMLNPNSYEGDFAWYAENIASECDQYLIVAQPKNLEGDNPALSFWHRYATEASWDGGVVEISTDEGLTWLDLGDENDPKRL